MITNEKNGEDESEQQTSPEPSVTIRKQVPSVDTRSNRKSMFEQSTTQTNTHMIERVKFILRFSFSYEIFFFL